MQKAMTNTLFNVNDREGRSEPSCGGLVPVASSETENSQSGVSLDYVRKEGYQWFVLRTTYNRSEQAYEAFVDDHVQTYLPMRYALKLVNGKKKRVLEPFLSNLIFIYVTPQQAEAYVSRSPELSSFLRYYRNRLLPRGFDDKHPPLVIRFADMMNFIRVTSVDNVHVRLIHPDQCHYKSGDRVRIIDGEFKGVVGRVARVAGQQRVVVELSGLCLVATAYVPSAFIERVEGEG